jgi:4-diphosphocytidyl-2-C-methyl-D-erythritol kinase
MKSIVLQAYAKINLILRIKEKRDDSYHNIESVFQAVDLFDTIQISREKSYGIDKKYCLTGTYIRGGNLVDKAKKALESVIGYELDCNLHLIKGIPLSAGLGGGSSDAAATLAGLNELYNLDLDKTKLAEIGAKVGSDVPFFSLQNPTAMVTGRGDKVEPLSVPLCLNYVLIRPHARLSTKEMYALHDSTKKQFNELAQLICPDTKRAVEFFSLYSSHCNVSGSGPTVFAGFDSLKNANKAVDIFLKEDFDGDIHIVRPADSTYRII